MKSLIAVTFIASISVLPFDLAWAEGGELSVVELNSAGVDELKKENQVNAERRFLDALGESPNHPVPRLNLGLTYEIQKQPQKAIKEYDAILRATALPKEIEFPAHFNAGNAAAAAKDIPLALRHYQAALDATTDEEQIKMVKNNIELLMQGGQGQGQGNSSGQNPSQDPKDQQGQGNQPKDQDQEKDGQDEKKQEKPKNFSKEEVKKIMEELKSQEQKIRALEYSNQKGKEVAPEKDW